MKNYKLRDRSFVKKKTILTSEILE